MNRSIKLRPVADVESLELWNVAELPDCHIRTWHHLQGKGVQFGCGLSPRKIGVDECVRCGGYILENDACFTEV